MHNFLLFVLSIEFINYLIKLWFYTLKIFGITLMLKHDLTSKLNNNQTYTCISDTLDKVYIQYITICTGTHACVLPI